jgi:hypothetical protein
MLLDISTCSALLKRMRSKRDGAAKCVMDLFLGANFMSSREKDRAIHDFLVDGFFELLLFCGVDWKRRSSPSDARFQIGHDPSGT